MFTWFFVDGESPMLLIGLLLAGSGFGMAFFQSPNNALIMSNAPQDKLGVAGSLNALSRNLGMITGTVTNFFINVLMPFYLENLRGLSTGTSGMYMLLWPVAMLVFSALSGTLADKMDREYVTLFGLTVLAIVVLFLGLNVAQVQGFLAAWPLALIVIAIILFVLFIRHELHAEKPLLDLTIFSSKLFTISLITAFLVLLGSILGPALGGLLLQHLSWSYIFWINVPIGIIAIVAGAFLLPKSSKKGVTSQIDWFGAVSLFLFVARIGTIVFTLGSVLAGIDLGLPFLLFARFVQAVGASMTMSNSFGITTTLAPQNLRGRAMSFIAAWVSTAVGLFTFMSTLDASIVNIALPVMSKEMNIPMNQATWTVSIYLIVISGLLALFGNLGDQLGKIKIFNH
ncbi:MFS transporter [Weissella confusa]|uniref:MFS transporter n=1 Tax=Weissella confusa TaxID=1583 RepID=A0A923SSV7_WEICO|nr:MFS transporter [Weissella confusa]